MTEAVATVQGKTLDARYTLLEKLGAGGQGEVWRAHDDTRGVDIALKVLNPTSREDEAWSALQHEYAIASRLDHPSILKVFAPERAGEAMVLPMELASGGDLRRLRGAGFLEIIPVLLEIAQALEHAHERGVVHRDLKPGNILFDARGRARLADFGVAETAMTTVGSSTPGSATATRDTSRHGFSPFTASPAQLRGDPPTPADDIYGLGALAYELLSGYPPYYPHFDKKRAIEERVPTLVPTRQIPPLLGTLVMNMLSKDPKRRPRRMREVIDELDAALNDTLTYDFENVSPATPTASAAITSAPSPASAVSVSQSTETQSVAARASRASEKNTSDSQAKPSVWTPDGHDRRSSPDRRGRRTEDGAPEVPREPTIPSDLAGVSVIGANNGDNGVGTRESNNVGGPSVRGAFTNGGASTNGASAAAEPDAPAFGGATSGAPTSTSRAFPASTSEDTERTTRRPGADALARIDAALERAAADAAAHPKPSSHRAPMTPAEAAAIVAAARAAASGHAPALAPRPVADRAATEAPAPSPSPRTTSAPGTPKSSMWPLERQASSTPTHSTQAAPPTQARSSAPTPPSAAPQQSNTIAPQLTSGRPNLTAGVHADPTSVHTRHTIHPDPLHATWGEIPVDGLPKVARLQPIRPHRWPWVVFGLMAGAAAAVYFWLPRFDTKTLPPEVAAVVEPLKSAVTSVSPETTSLPVSTASPARGSMPPGAAAGDSVANGVGPQETGAQEAGVRSAGVPAGSANSISAPPVFTAGDEQHLRQMRQLFDNRLASLDARGGGVWGGREFAMAKTRAAESVGARDAGNPRMAEERLAVATKLLDSVESKAPQALSAQVAAGEQALGAGQQEVAGQAFDLAHRINPSDRRASDGQRRVQNLPAVLPLLADAKNAEVAHDYARAAQDYSQALSLDPGNAIAREGQARSNAAFGDDNYAKAVGAGFAALGAGRLDEAHESFVKARALKPGGAEASEGLRRVVAALTARGFASMRQRAAGLENQERWDEAERTYEDVLAADSSLAFAQEGKARTTSRADLSIRLQQLIDRPDRLSSPGVRDDARALLETARAQSPQGPVIRSQIARLEVLLPGLDKPVRLSLVSDNSTQVAISSIGAFGTFSRRDIELRPGKYTVVGTRNGFRDVRREITVAPGQDSQTIRVTCSEPI